MDRITLGKLLDEVSIKKYQEKPRTHLGASKIGGLCDRALFYDFRWMNIKAHSGRLYRLFNRGTREEDSIIELLELAGFEILERQRTFSSCGGHFGGSCDGILKDPTGRIILLEIKTNKGGSDFKPLFEKGVKEFIPSHYNQMCMYGYKFNIDTCLYISVNKSNDDIYTEYVTLDFEVAAALERKAEDIILFNELPRRFVNASSTLYYCKHMCDHYDCCFGGKPIMKNCRSCQHSRAIEGKQWSCILVNTTIPQDFISCGCDQWRGII